MTALNSPHDRFFKAVFGRAEVAAEFLAQYLPSAVAETLDWTTLRAEKDSFLDPELAQHPTDLLYAVDVRGGGMGYIGIRSGLWKRAKSPRRSRGCPPLKKGG